ncbi:MAG: peptidyl-prolyl cis-trans isomerase, partial [Rhodospirillales bacterium]|nr:peptidyl-prolyl cis-trans isomerase [Rhodospirillales bacterium]
FAAVAKEEAGLDAGALDLGTLTRDELIAELADPVFAVAQGKVTAPIKSALGWHIVEVTAIEPASTRSLADVRDELTKTIAMDKAVDALYDLSTRLEDTLGGGASLEDAAQSLNLKLLKIAALDSLGRDVDGKAVTGMPSELPATAFATDVGSDSLLTDTNDGGYFIVRVDEVTPPRLEPLDAVRARVLEAAMTEKRAAAAKEAAEALAEQVRGGADMATAAADKGFKATTGKPVKRSGEGGGDGWPQQLIASVFSAEQGNTVVVDAGNASFVARVNEVRKADPSADKNGLTAIDDEMTQALRNGMLDELVGALRRRHPVKANPQVINKLFETP